MKTISTTVKTGDKFKFKETVYEVGLFRKINNKNLIDLKVKVGKCSSITLQVSTRELNKMLSDSEIIDLHNETR